MPEDLKNYQVKCSLPPNVGQYDHLFEPLPRGPSREDVIARLRTGSPHPDDLPPKPDRRGMATVAKHKKWREQGAEIERLKGELERLENELADLKVLYASVGPESVKLEVR